MFFKTQYHKANCKRDWFDEHVEVIGENAEVIKEKIKEKLVCKACNGTGSLRGGTFLGTNYEGEPEYEECLEPCDNCKGGIV